jgi:hypothetical protein
MERIRDEVARTLERASGAPELADVVTTWPDVVGEAIARNAWPLRLARDGTLHVATSSSTWACELARLAPELVDRLRRALGDAAPAAVRFRPGPVPEAPTPAAGRSSAPAPVDPDAAAAAEELTRALEEGELRSLVVRAARASLARRRYDRHI